MSLIEVRHLSKIFSRGGESVQAIKEISLTINEGEFIAITGASGSGKSTLLHLLGLLDIPTTGHYQLLGKEVSQIEEAERATIRNSTFGFIFQSFHLMPKFSALENVAMPLMYSKTSLTKSECQKRSEEALKLVHLEERMSHLPNELSGGQRQRVAIARALVCNPQIILADEPTGNLDSKNAREVIDLLDNLNQKGVTIILVTHDHDIAQRASRQIVLKDGVVESDTRTAPATREVSA